MQADRSSRRPVAGAPSGSGPRAGRRARAVLERPAQPQARDTSDEHEIELRRWRGRAEITAVQCVDLDHSVFGAFRARSESGGVYDVEIRSLETFLMPMAPEQAARCEHFGPRTPNWWPAHSDGRSPRPSSNDSRC
jgi:hypothetical protein